MTRVRGEGISGEKGKGFVGTIIKDTWTITGWKWDGGGECWGLGWGAGKRQRTELEQKNKKNQCVHKIYMYLYS